MNEVKVKVSELMKVSVRSAERRTIKQATHEVKELDKERGRSRTLKENKKAAYMKSESLGDILGVAMHIYLRATLLCRFTVQHRTPKRGALDYCPCRIPAQTWAKL
jgi:hypothetical protein